MTERAELNHVAQLLIDAWERAEGQKVGVSYVATFVDMAPPDRPLADR